MGGWRGVVANICQREDVEERMRLVQIPIFARSNACQKIRRLQGAKRVKKALRGRRALRKTPAAARLEMFRAKRFRCCASLRSFLLAPIDPEMIRALLWSLANE